MNKKKQKSEDQIKNSLPKKYHWESVDNVHKIIKNFITQNNDSFIIDTEKADGYVLAKKVFSKLFSPPFNNSAVDGWAIKGPVPSGKLQFKIISRIISAGSSDNINIEEGYSVKILTGAKLPNGTDTVILDEKVTVLEKKIFFNGPIEKGNNIRLKGEDIIQGKKLFDKGHVLRPQDIALLVSAGIKKVECKKRLRVGLLSTGDELIDLGENINFDDDPTLIYDSNRPMILNLLSRWNLDIINLGIVKDNYKKINEKINSVSDDVDLFVTTGGVSAGNKDYLSKIIMDNGKLIVWRVAIKPGRPMAFGNFNNKPFFALPGNPVAAFVCSLIFVYPSINLMLGKIEKPNRKLRLKSSFVKKKMLGRTEYLRAKISDQGLVDIFHSEGSGRISSLSWSDGLVELDENTAEIKKGDTVDFIPYSNFGI